MAAFIFCLVVGFLQTVLLSVCLTGALAGNMKKALISILLKSALYGVSFTILYFVFIDSVIFAGAGFVAGVIASVIFIALKSFFDNKKGDDKIDHGRDN